MEEVVVGMRQAMNTFASDRCGESSLARCGLLSCDALAFVIDLTFKGLPGILLPCGVGECSKRHVSDFYSFFLKNGAHCGDTSTSDDSYTANTNANEYSDHIYESN